MSLGKEIPVPSCAGLISFSRVSGQTCLFGSPFIHQGYIKLEIHRAALFHDGADSKYFQRERLFSAQMSYSQFAEAITTMNMGSGVPCTLSWLNGKKIEPPALPQVERQEFEEATQERIEKCKQKINEAIASIEGIKMSEKEKNRLKLVLDSLKTELGSSLPFIAECYAEYMDKVEQQAKTDIAAYIDMSVKQYGIESIQQKQIEGN